MAHNLTLTEMKLLTEGYAYSVAVVRTDGEFEIIDRFTAMSNDEANDYAAKHHPNVEWYVLNCTGKNINGGDQS
jgi:hypothetical protein